MELRDYQKKFKANFETAIASVRRIIGVAPTGAGKTVLFCSIIADFAAQLRNVLVLSHRREIISQTSDKLKRYNVTHGVLQAGLDHLARPQACVQVASIQTLTARAVRSNRIELPPADLVVIDEAHHVVAETYQKIVKLYPNAIIFGLTATPCRGDGRGLGTIFETMIEAPQVPDLIKLGFLVPTKVYAPTQPDLRGVETRLGDYVKSQLAERMDRPELVGDIVTHWLRLGENRPTVCFATAVGHSVHIRDRFLEAGIRCEHIDGTTPKTQRDETLQRLASGELQVVTNCMVLTEGWDCPTVSGCILARPTKSMGLFRQMIGRVLRPSEGKKDALILDHSGAVFRHGFVEDEVQWPLHPDKRAENTDAASASSSFESSSRLIECSQCSAIRTAGQPCPHRGFMPQRPPKTFVCHDGDLGLVEGGRANAPVYDAETKRQWWAMLTAIGQERDYKPNWPAVNFKEKFGHYPGSYGATIEPEEPTPEVCSWVRSRMIAYAKGKGRAA